MRHADHRALKDTGQVVQRIFNFCRVDIQAAADDEVFAAPHDTHIALRIAAAHVAGDEVAIRGELLRGFLGHAPIACKHIGPLDLNAADLALRHFPVLLISNAQTHPRQRETHATAHTQGLAAIAVIGCIRVGGQHQRFAHPIALQHRVIRALLPLGEGV